MKFTSKILIGVAVAVAVLPKVVTVGIILGIIIWSEKKSKL